MLLDRHELAAISIAGIILDVFGGLYLAYDLLGGEKGPLRAVTRGGTYALIFAILYSVIMGPRFGLIAGVGLGLILGFEFHRTADIHARRSRYSFGRDPAVLAFGIIRGVALGVAGALSVGPWFGLYFGVLAMIGLVIAYSLHFSPSADYPKTSRIRIRPRVVIAGSVRGFAVGAAALIAGIAAREGLGESALLALRIGFAVWLVGALLSAATPRVESWGISARRLGLAGVVLILLGLAAQSFQYWVVLLS